MPLFAVKYVEHIRRKSVRSGRLADLEGRLRCDTGATESVSDADPFPPKPADRQGLRRCRALLVSDADDHGDVVARRVDRAGAVDVVRHRASDSARGNGELCQARQGHRDDK